MNQTQRTSTYKDPSWWNNTHSSAWDRTKEALHRDWEQTKADVSKGGHELNQDVGDTVKQSAGKQAIPPGNTPNPPTDKHYGAQPWNSELEGKLRKDWVQSGNESAWDRVKAAVRRGWESVKS
jgi:hypothetical protein